MLKFLIRKYAWLFFLLGFVIALLGIRILYIKSLSPYEFILKDDYADATVSPAELLIQERIGETDKHIVFFINQKGDYSCAILKETLISYKIVGYSGSLSNKNDDTYLYAKLKDGDDFVEVCWGILNDASISSVVLDEDSCFISKTDYPNLRIFWLIDHWEEMPTLTMS